jgi:hypothetical protein
MNHNRKVVYFVTILLVSCTSRLKKEVKEVERVIITAEEVVLELKPVEANYHLIATVDTLDWLKKLKTGDTLDALLCINRVDRLHLSRQDTLVFPDTISGNLDLYCPFPENIERLNDVDKMIFISYYVQAFAVYQNGKRIRWGPVSLGKESTQTPKGLFFTNWKSKKTYSTVDPSWVLEWYFNIANYDGVSLHEYGLPGYPASHSCIRLFKEDAHWFYYWADQWKINPDQTIAAYGTPILIYGDYPFQVRKPWLELAKDPLALKQSEEILNDAFAKHLRIILARQEQRAEIEKRLEAKKIGLQLILD